MAYFKEKKFNQALRQINKAIEINSKIYYYYLVKADIYSLLKRETQEVENLKKSISIMPKAYLYYERKNDIKNEKDGNYYLKRLEKLNKVNSKD